MTDSVLYMRRPTAVSIRFKDWRRTKSFAASTKMQVTQMMGIGYLGEVRQGPDGALYQYVQGVDGLGNPIGGFWSRLKRRVKSVVGRALPIAQQVAPFIPGGVCGADSGDPVPETGRSCGL